MLYNLYIHIYICIYTEFINKCKTVYTICYTTYIYIYICIYMYIIVHGTPSFPRRCHTHLVTTDAVLHALPRRRTDGALVLDARRQVVRLYTTRREGSRAVRREKGVERQYLHGCPGCDQDVAYTGKGHDQPLELLYLLEKQVDVPWHRMKSPWTCKAGRLN